MFNVLLVAVLALQPSPAHAPPAASSAADHPPSSEQVLAVPDELRETFRRQVVETTRSPGLRLKRLVHFMFDPSGLGVEYDPGATHTVAETFRTRKANCLAFTLLTVALAREAGLQAYGQQIDRVLSWDVADKTILQSMHANAGVVIDDRHYVVDVATNEILASTERYPIDDEHLLALFYDNRAMELMVAGRYSEAKNWLDEALRHNPEDAALWNNAGVLSLRVGGGATAESLFLKAADKDPRLTSVISNLIAFYQDKGDTARAAQWQERADKASRKDPFYQFTLGQRQEQAGDYAEAVRHYRRAIALNRSEELFHFGLARAYFHMGRLRSATTELGHAQDLSSGQDRERYRTKLDVLGQIRR